MSFGKLERVLISTEILKGVEFCVSVRLRLIFVLV